jgi:Xaa-Pro aminopeptidase
MGMIKTQREISLLRKSARITDSCISLIESSLKEDITEAELRRRIAQKIRSQGAGLAFQTLVASGKRSAMIHCKPWASNAKISGMGYADFGASYKGYKTDVTVPFMKGNIGASQKKIIKATIESYHIALKTLRIGTPCWKSFEAVENHFRIHGFRQAHSLGHGLGLKVHERPIILMPRKKRLSPKGQKRWDIIKKVTYQKNMVFAIEPGIYRKNLGGCRIENDFLMTSKGAVRLTNARLLTV